MVKKSKLLEYLITYAETLKKKEANADAEIDLLVENCLRGIKPRRPGPPGRPPVAPEK